MSTIADGNWRTQQSDTHLYTGCYLQRLQFLAPLFDMLALPALTGIGIIRKRDGRIKGTDDKPMVQA